MPQSERVAVVILSSEYCQNVKNLTDSLIIAVIIAPVLLEHVGHTNAKFPSLTCYLWHAERAISKQVEEYKACSFMHEEDWAHVSDSAKDCVSKLLTRSKDERMAPAQFLQHAWVTHEHAASQPALPPAVTERLCRVSACIYPLLSSEHCICSYAHASSACAMLALQ